MTGRKPFAEREPHVFEIAARTVDQHNRQRGGLHAKRDDMLSQSGDVDETSTRRMRALDQP